MPSTTKQEPVTTNYEYPVHPAAEAFPLDIASDKFDALVADIKANGLREPIVLDVKGQLIDGRHRLAACKRLGIEMKTTTYEGDAVAYVISTNLHRRHLTDEQRVAAATMLANLSKGKTRSSTDKAVTQEEAAKLCGVSDRSIRIARAAADKAGEAVLHLMRDGKIAVRMAERISLLEKGERNAYLSKLKAATDAESLKAVRKEVDTTYAKTSIACARRRARDTDKRRAAKNGVRYVEGTEAATADDNSPSWDAAWSEPIELLTSLGNIDFAKLLRDTPLSGEQRQELDVLISKARAVLDGVVAVEEMSQQLAA